MQRQRSFLRANSFFVEDLPEMGQRHTEKIQKTVANQDTRTDRTNIFRSPEDPEVCRGTTSCSETGRSPRDPEDREDSTTDSARSEPRGPDKTQRGQSPVGQTRPSIVKGPEWSEPKEARQTRGTPSTNSVQPTQPVRKSTVRPRASRSSSQGGETSGN